MKTLAPGTCITLWNGGTLSTVLDANAAKLIERARPQYISIHGGPERLLAALPTVAKQARALMPNVQLIVGVGLDYWTGQTMAGKGDQALRVIEEAVDVAVDLDCRAAIWDAEVDTKVTPVDAMIRELVKSTRAAHADLVQIHTDSDHPGSHAANDWIAWLNADGCDVEMPQFYVANDPHVAMQPRGALQAREASAAKSYAAATNAGWMRPGLFGAAAYFQIHGTPAEDLIEVGARYPLRALWTSSLVDDAGANAAVALCKLSRLGLSLEKFQATMGLEPDGVCGKLTMAALEAP